MRGNTQSAAVVRVEFDETIEIVLAERRRARRAYDAGQRRDFGRGRLGGKIGEHLPALAGSFFQPDRRGQIFRAGFFRIERTGEIAIPEKAVRNDIAGEFGEHAAGGNSGEAGPKRGEAGIGRHGRRRHPHAFIRLCRGLRPRLMRHRPRRPPR